MLDQLNIEVIQAVRTAIGRSRIMTTLLVIASVLATIAYWNGRENSWTRLRYNRQYALNEINEYVKLEVGSNQLKRYKSYLLTTKGLPVPAGLSDPDTFAKQALDAGKLDMAGYWEIIEPKVDERFVDMIRQDDPAAHTPEKWWRWRNAMLAVNDWKQELPEAESYARQLREGYLQTTLLVNLPFFGVSFDLNDLALLSGLTFTLLLIGACYALIREHSAVDTVSEMIDAVDASTPEGQLIRRRIYQVTAHANVLTIPPPIRGPHNASHGRRQFDRFTDGIFKALGAMLRIFPAVIFTFIYINDRGTTAYGAALSPERLTSLMIASTIFLVLVWVFSGAALLTNWRLETRWKDLSDKIS